jgi:hypothetical protein
VRDPSATSIGDGRAYLPDATADEFAVVREPLFRRPSMYSNCDNPFNTAYESIESFFGCANAVVMFGRILCMLEGEARDRRVAELMHAVDCFVSGDEKQRSSWLHAPICADVLLLLNLMYPLSYKIGENAVLESISKLPSLVHRSNGPLSSIQELTTREVEEVRTFWTGILQICQDGPLLDFLHALDVHDGKMDVTASKCAEVRELLEKSAQACLHVHAAFGDLPTDHPLHGLGETRRVRGTHLNGVFVSDPDKGVEQRGGLIGCKPHQLRQVCSLAMGVGVEGVACQFCRNEGAYCLELLHGPTSYSNPTHSLAGGLSLRVSSAADLLDEKGNERSSKSISPVRGRALEPCISTVSMNVAHRVACAA